ncbi:carboxylesterase family protein [Amycolatopsis rhabdoformis]|uniref:Carboxylic ester hydrolase n=1 Tax=Amycolatopsis rhabdoformis TaxID=1448059 RepID=A0ABZ1IJS0_9PSEU|nr:carboxylesterase family protein [Amycolatopsis rhabdoformis]WSE34725.1 carboxylesterase family protein [Amycolatopsis rhabdoformis]
MGHEYWETAPKLTVPTASGPIRGLVSGGLHRFLGIPYAAAPVGELRWRPPAPVAGRRLPRDAFSFGPVCAQNNTSFPGFGFSSNTEDCLYLNVFAPEGADEHANLPVMVLFPGGGLFIGGSDDYDPSALVTSGRVVFVSLNYRVGIFGFFSHPAINAEDHEIGNYGILDQQAALRWVRDNIAAFGGDPSNVTIFGESAGGISVWCHLASPGSAGLFHRAIVQSGTATPLLRTPETRDLDRIGHDLCRDAGASRHTSEELRALATTDLLAANLLPEGEYGTGKYEIGQTADGAVIPEPMVDLFTTGRFARVPIINGTTRTEFHWFQGMLELATGQPIPTEAYLPVLTQALTTLPELLIGRTVDPARIADVAEAYPPEKHGSASEAMSTAIGDCGFIGLGNREANRVLRRFVEHVYSYELDAPHLPTPWPPVSFPYGSAHTKDLQYLFPGFGGAGGQAIALDGADLLLSDTMVGYWAAFAHHGSPNAPASPLPEWKAYDPVRDNVLVLAAPASYEVENFGERHRSAFWDDVSAGPAEAAG